MQGKRKTEEEVLLQALEVHKCKYIYPRFIFTKVNSKSIITCPEHGDFEQIVGTHLNGNGCPKCRYNNRKMDFRFIKSYIENDGYELLSKNYIGAHSKLKILCPEGHKFEVSWSNFRHNGQRCKTCYFSKRRIPITVVQDSIEVEGYKLISTEYINSKEKLKIRCSKGHEYKGSWGNWSSGDRCPICKYIKIGENLTHDYKFVKEKIEVDGYKLISTEYINSKEKLKILCPEGHDFTMTFSSFYSGYQRCPQCAITKRSKARTKSTEEFIQDAWCIHGDRYNYKLSNYVYNKSKIKIICHIHGVFEQTPNIHLKGGGCRLCGFKQISESKTKSTEEFIQDAWCIHGDRYNYKLVEYIHSKDKIKIICHIHGVFEQMPNTHLMGGGCTACIAGNHSSKSEQEIQSYVSQYVDIIKNDRTQIHNPETGWPLELDIWIPKLNIAIEFNGTYWHSFEEMIRKDKIKQEQCLSKGIKLIVVEEDEWEIDKVGIQEDIKYIIEYRSKERAA